MRDVYLLECEFGISQHHTEDCYVKVEGPVFLIDRVAGLMVDDSDVVLRGLIDDGILKEIK